MTTNRRLPPERHGTSFNISSAAAAAAMVYRHNFAGTRPTHRTAADEKPETIVISDGGCEGWAVAAAR